MPNAPLIRMSAPNRDQPVRPSRNARRYSTTWIRASHGLGIWTLTMRPETTRLPLTGRIAPPAATIRVGSSANGWVTRSSASGSRIESASTIATSGSLAALMPTLRASERPEFSLRTTTRRVRPSRGTCTSMIRARIGHVLRDHARDGHEVERAAQPLEGAVGAAVVDDDDLVPRVAQGEQGLHRRDDPDLLVVRGHEQRDARGQGAAEGLDDRLTAPVLGPEVDAASTMRTR